MLKTRVIPCLLLHNAALVKTIQFRDPSYVGDPSNAIRIFNEKEVDELILLDILVGVSGRPIALDLVERLAAECFMPVTYGGGIRDIETMRGLFKRGIEKVAINTIAFQNPTLIRSAADEFGSQAILISVDAMRTDNGRYEVCTHAGKSRTGVEPRQWVEEAVKLGAGEILLTAIDRDGTQSGYDIDLLRSICPYVDVPVIACGGAGRVTDFTSAVVDGGASAVAAGSMVVYFGRNRAVLISFPTKRELNRALN